MHKLFKIVFNIERGLVALPAARISKYKRRGTVQSHRILASVALLFALCSLPAHATLISANFFIQASEGSATGVFSGTDANANQVLEINEVVSFMIRASGNAFTGVPTPDTLTFGAPNTNLDRFEYNATLSLLDFDVSNLANRPGALRFIKTRDQLGSPVLAYSVLQASGRIIRRSTSFITSLRVTPVTQVPEPPAIALLGAGVIAFGVLRRKKRYVGE